MTDHNYGVYRIKTSPSGTNAYGVSRTECWHIIFDENFQNEEEAKEYVIKQNLPHATILPSLLIGKNEQDRQEMLNNFCFTPEYAHHRRYFLGYPDTEVIRKNLWKLGVKIVTESS